MAKKVLSLMAILLATIALVVGAMHSSRAQARQPGRISGLPAPQADWRYYPQAASGNGLSAAEQEALAYMREEEKLAHDAYAVFYARSGQRIFQHIGMCEQMHTSMVRGLIARYGLADPAQAQAGKFSNPNLQALYDKATAAGSQSLAEAYKSSGAIEEIDILDLEKRLAETDHGDIQQVFRRLTNGSFNHLRAYSASWSAQTGKAYQPQFMSLEAYRNIAGAGGSGGMCGCCGGM